MSIPKITNAVEYAMCARPKPSNPIIKVDLFFGIRKISPKKENTNAVSITNPKVVSNAPYPIAARINPADAIGLAIHRSV